MGHVGFGGVAEVGVGGGGCFEAETDVLGAAGDVGPVEEFVGGGGGGGCGFLPFGGVGGGHGCGGGAGGCEMGGMIGGECEAGCKCDDSGARATEGCNEH